MAPHCAIFAAVGGSENLVSKEGHQYALEDALEHQVAPMTTGCYHTRVHGITIKFDEAQLRWIRGQAKARRCSKALVIRELVDQKRSAVNGMSLHDQMLDLCGALKGSKDLSTRKLTRYGRD